MRKYTPLAEHLAALSTSNARLTFPEIEGILRAVLPPSAYKHHAWWSNADRGANGWSNLWKRAGWIRDAYSLRDQWVTFIRPEHYAADSEKAREGYEIDRRILARARDAKLSTKRKEIDNYTCQACDFRLKLHDKYVIEVHHINPLAATGETTTQMKDLVSLCPTCHRIAHLRNPPYEVDELRPIRATARDA